MPHYEESDIALLENTDTDGRLPIILHKVEEGQENHGEEHSDLLNGEKALYGMDIESKVQLVQGDTQDKVKKDVYSGLELIGSLTQEVQRGMANLSARRTEDNPKENSEKA